MEHGWLRVPNAIKQQYVDQWLAPLWDRLGWDEHDKSTWQQEYLKMPRHFEAPVEDVCPAAWAKMQVAFVIVRPPHSQDFPT